MTSARWAGGWATRSEPAGDRDDIFGKTSDSITIANLQFSHPQPQKREGMPHPRFVRVGLGSDFSFRSNEFPQPFELPNQLSC